MIEVVLVEDNKTIRDGLSLLLNATDGLNCTAKYKNCEDMLLDLKNGKPDLILMDIGLPGMSGIEGVKIRTDAASPANHDHSLPLTIFAPIFFAES